MKCKITIVTFFVFIQSALVAQTTIDNLRRHERFLASDSLEGRGTGEPGNLIAAQYIAHEFASIGLDPLGDTSSYYQSFSIIKDLQLGQSNQLKIQSGKEKIELKVGQDFLPVSYSKDTSVSGQAVFVGYGISASDRQVDDYAQVDVKGKVVLVIRYAPKSDSVKYTKYSELRYKVLQAREHGAAAVLAVTASADDPEDKLIKLKYDYSFGDAGIPVLSISRLVANQILSAAKVYVDSLHSGILVTGKSSSFVIPNTTVSLTSSLVRIKKNTSNVLGILKAPVNPANEHIVLGAHFDHLGYGGEGSGSLEPDKHLIHYGADDNASGTSALIEIARSLKSHQSLLKRDIIFIAFTGEELGVLGSAYYTKNPKAPLQKTAAMLNLDMVGRLQNKTLSIHGTGTSSGWENLLNASNSDSTFVLKFVKDGFGPSDHSSFYVQHVPVLFFFTGIHTDYHKPSDTYDKINYEGLTSVAKFVITIAMCIDTTAQRPDFQKTQSAPQSSGENRGYRVYVGTIPDFSETVDGMKISGVREKSPAAKAGLQTGDIIIKFGKYSIKSLYDYSTAIQEYKPGDTVNVFWKRGLETKIAPVVLEVRK